MASGVVNSELPVDPTAATLTAAEESRKSYGQILKSSALIGGSQLINVLIGIGRTKAMAMLLGPSGFGIAGLYNSIIDLTSQVVGLGVNSSGVRQIAEAVGSNDTERISMTVAVLRRTSLILGMIAALVMIAFCRPISVLTFGTNKYALGIALLSVAAILKLVSGGQTALIQGMRRIAELAKISAWGALLGATAGIVFVYFLREEGIIPYLVCVAGTSTLMSWWYARKIETPKISISLSQVRHEVSALLKLGIAFMISSVVTIAVAYATRVIVLHKVGIEGTGLYQSAWTIGGMYVGFILQAMGADFYPRLTANIHNHAASNRLVNEQARIGLLLAAPGVLATLTFAPLVIAAVYSSKFGGSVPILRWVCLGTMLQVITWPMGFIIVAKGRQNLLVFCEVAWAVVSLLLAFLCVNWFGLNGAGMAFFLSYVFHGILLYVIVRKLSGFRWNGDNVRTAALFLPVIGIVFVCSYILPVALSVLIGTLAVAGTSVYSLRFFAKIMPAEYLPQPVFRMLLKLHLVKSPSSTGTAGNRENETECEP